MKFKQMIVFSLALFLIPGVAAANQTGAMPDAKVGHQEKSGENSPGMHHGHNHMMHKDWQAKMQEREKQLLAWVNEYTPDKKAEWDKVIKEKNELRNKWMSPENATKREEWKKEKMAKMEELKKQLDGGKITKEEFLNKAHGDKKIAYWRTYHDLKEAVKNKDNKKAANLLNQMLVQSKEHNEKMKEMLES